ncbi:TPA_asm: P3 [Pelargonium alphacytorhabdovirus 1]|nr:TPA_asm: P3 [Pelargonium alphacytorhabdovirus 1]
MASSFSFKIKTELTTSSETGSVSLTKKLNFFQMMSARWADNIRIKRIVFIYEPRVGELGRGEVTAQIVDNRIDDDLDNNIIRELTFDVRQQVKLTWEHDVQLFIGDLKHHESEPIILRTTVSGSNMKNGFSLGQIRVNIEMATYANMLYRIKAKPPVAKLSPIPQRKLVRSMSVTESPPKQPARLGGSSRFRYMIPGGPSLAQ